MKNLFRGIEKEMDARHERERATPRILYRNYYKRVGIVHAGCLHVSNSTTSGESYVYYNNQVETRVASVKDMEAIRAAEAEEAAARLKLDNLLKRVWKRSRELEPDEVADMGATDYRSNTTPAGEKVKE